MFQQLLREENICIGLKAENQKSALKQLVESIPQGILNAEQKEELLLSIIAREKFGTTAIGDGVALPRAISAYIKNPIAVLGINRAGIPYPSLDGTLVYIVFLLVWPDRAEMVRERQFLLHSAEQFFRDGFLRERIKIADNAEDVYEILLREGSQVIGNTGRIPVFQASHD